MKRLLPLVLLAGCIPGTRAHGPVPRPIGLAAVVDSVTSSPGLRHATFGIEVYDPVAGRTLLALNADKHFVPASNTKLVATSAAMALLGPDWRYHTEVEASGPDARGVARAVIVTGHGDPSWTRPFAAADFAVAEALADSIRAAGIRRIDGDLVVDASAFERTALNDTWQLGDLVWDYAAPTAAVAVAEGTRRVVIVPGVTPGAAAGIRFVGPEPQAAVVNRVVTGHAGDRLDIEPERLPGVDTLFLRGTIPFGAAPDTETITVVEPNAFAGRVLAAELARRGIPVGGAVRVVYDSAEALALRLTIAQARSAAPPPVARRGRAPARPSAAPPPDPALAGRAVPAASPLRRIATWTSPPLADIVAYCLARSDNWLAEQLLKTLGAVKQGAGSWPAGLAVERAYLTGPVGLDSLDFALHDASGLSVQNLLTPHAIVRLLAYARSQPWGARFHDGLAQPGQKGTLERRLAALQGRLYAKTGSLTNVNSLSGYVRTDRGRDLVFSILTNGSGVPAAYVRAGIDRIVAAIAAGDIQ